MGPLLRSLARRRLASLLFVLEVAFGLAVSVHAYLLGARFDRPGPSFAPLDAEHVLLAVVTLESGDFDSPSFRAGVVRRDGEALAEIPGVAAFAEADELALNRSHLEAITADGAPERPAGAWLLDDRGGVVGALGLQLVAGRALAPADADAAGEMPGVITEALAERLGLGQGALGRVLHRSHARRPVRVVGVVRSFPAVSGRSDDAASALLVPERPWLGRTLQYLVRVTVPEPPGVVEAITATLSRQSPARGVLVRRLDAGASRVERNNRGARGVALFMSGLMLLFVLLGRAGTSSFVVAARRKEIGVRRALGATRGDVARWLLAEDALLTAAGLALGVGLCVALNRVARALALSFPLDLDPATVGAACAIFWIVGVLAALATARAAASVPPGEAART
jgi:putative ABC transport system permease protein